MTGSMSMGGNGVGLLQQPIKTLPFDWSSGSGERLRAPMGMVQIQVQVQVQV